MPILNGGSIRLAQLMKRLMLRVDPHRTCMGSKTGLTASQGRSLIFLYHWSDCRMGDVAKALDLTRPEATRVVDALIRKGLADRVVDESDRRVVRVRITSEGREIVDGLREEMAQSLRKVIDRMAPEDVAALERGLAALDAAMDEVECESLCDKRKEAGA